MFAETAGDDSRHAVIDAELLLDFRGWASRLSGRAEPKDAAPPALIPLSIDDLTRTVCSSHPRGCSGLVAAYDTLGRRIVYRASLDMRDPTDQSFIVHELVHWLQHLAQGDRLDADCPAVLAAEREAYGVQNLYLARFKQWQRVGEVMRFTFCPADTAGAAADPVVKFDASTGPITAGRQWIAPDRSLPATAVKPALSY